MKKTYIIISLLLLTSISLKVFAQVPQIQKVEAQSTYPLNKIIISGSGFSATPSNLQVWFDQVKGNITASTDYSIEVEVPAQAKLSNVEVINLTSKLSAKSNVKFMASFSGEPFDETKFVALVPSFSSTYELWDLCSCDLNNDSKPDIISTKQKDPATDLMILQNTSSPGALSFSKLDKTNLAALDLTFPTDNVICGDLQGDGKPDLVITRSGFASVHILTNTSSGSISFAAPISLSLKTLDIAIRSSIKDLNGDGKPEIIVTNNKTNIIYVFVNQSSLGTLSFNPTPVEITVTGSDKTYSIDVQDMDGDGLPDIIVTRDQAQKEFFILKNSSASSISFPSVQKIIASVAITRITTADVNKDGLLDLIAASSFSNNIMVMLNKSTSSGFSFPSTLTLSLTGTQGWGVEVSDIDGDGDPDIIATSRNFNIVNVFLHSGNYSLPSFNKRDILIPKFSRNIIVGDLDGDGKPDIGFTSFNSTGTYTLDILRNTNCHQPKILNVEPLVICSGQTIRLNTIPALNVNFSWTKDAVGIAGTNSYLDITAAGTYMVTAIGEGGGCSKSASITVTANAGAPPSNPTITAPPSTVCSGGSILLSTNDVADTYTWTGPNNFTASGQTAPTINSVTSSNAGIYTLQLANGVCKSNIVSAKVDVVEIENLSISSTVTSNKICAGNNLTLSVKNDPISYNYLWNKDGGDIGAETTYKLTVSTSGVYKVKVTPKTVSCPAITTEAVTVSVLPKPTITTFDADGPKCSGELVTITNTVSPLSPSSPFVYTLNFGDATSSTTVSGSHTHNYTTPGNTNITRTANLVVGYQDVPGCSSLMATKDILIKAVVSPTIESTATTMCPGETTTLSIPNTYTNASWSTQSNGLTTDINTPGDYTVTAVDATTGCPVSAEITITSKEVPTITVTADNTNIIAGTKSQLQASGADSYLWSPAETLSDVTIANPIASPITTTTYTVTGTSITGCSASNQIVITVDGSKINIVIPPAFSPNGDGSNETLIIQGISDYPQCVLNIFDGRGRRVYQVNATGENWDGTYQGKPVPDGTYYYVFGCPDSKPVTGSILIFR